MLKQFWIDDGGAVISSELCVIGAALILALVVGAATLQDAIQAEYEDVGDAIEAFDFTPNPNGEETEMSFVDTSTPGGSPLTAADLIGGE